MPLITALHAASHSCVARVELFGTPLASPLLPLHPHNLTWPAPDLHLQFFSVTLATVPLRLASLTITLPTTTTPTPKQWLNAIPATTHLALAVRTSQPLTLSQWNNSTKALKKCTTALSVPAALVIALVKRAFLDIASSPVYSTIQLANP
ncbi:hypothetical protein AX14_001318 [Amanita brunnescens Koide BX004]|nr:hypothetical protein AX14_001318 [Amanita brunnescens Koide BX004]